ncbi:MAG TPA: hypothetical protein VFO83_00715 [Aggregicoccus sp.]|nr:hypothetical protein [Aggregicoccus sp.]
MSRRSPSVRALALLALLPAQVLAASVYLNGVRIDGVTNQQFDKARVRIDAQGNVHIDAPGYAVRQVTPPPAAPAAAPAAPAPTPEAAPPPAPSRRYWLVTEQTEPGLAEFDVDVFVNGRWVRKLRGSEPQVIAELTPHLRPGKNTVLLSARKTAGASRKSLSPAHQFRVIIGEGTAEEGRVVLEKPLVRFQRSAAEAHDVSEEFSITTR